MDAFIDASANLVQRLLPTCFFIIAILLIVVLWHLLKLLKRLITLFSQSEETISLITKSLIKIQTPLDSGVKAVDSIDKFCQKSANTFNSGLDYLKQNKDNLMQQVDKIWAKVKKEEVLEPKDEDILGKNN